MGKVFNFYNYEFSNDAFTLEEYLISNHIEYTKDSGSIKFFIKIDDSDKLVSANSIISNNKVERMYITITPKSYSSRKNIETEIEHRYNLISKDMNTMTRVYEADDYKIIFQSPENIRIDIQFENVTIEMERKQDKEHRKKVIIFTAIGLLLSVLFMMLYFSFKEMIWLHIMTAIISILYALYQFFYLYLKNILYGKTEKIIICILGIIIFIGLVLVGGFFVIARIGADAGDMNVFNNNFNILDMLMCIIYALPAFHLVLLILALFSYA